MHGPLKAKSITVREAEETRCLSEQFNRVGSLTTNSS
jgi:hypothetical protein